jgi:hypothetical protein
MHIAYIYTRLRQQTAFLHAATDHPTAVKLAKLTESPSGMLPPSPSKSPSKFPMSPPMPLFPVSPERAAGTRSPFGIPSAQSPSLSDLRTSPLRKHRRNDSDVSVQGLAAMFENLEVKDFKEAQAKYLVALQKERTKHAADMTKMERKYQMMERYRVRVDELEQELKRKAQEHDGCVPREVYDRYRKDNRDAIAKWEQAFKRVEEQNEQREAKMVSELQLIWRHN